MTGGLEPNRYTLLVDTSQPELLLALCDDTGTLYYPDLNGVIAPEAAPNQHASRFFPVLERLLSQVALPLSALTAVAINTGPGSFTGLRVGLTFVRMLTQFSPALTRILPLTAFELYAALPGLRGRVLDIKLNAYRGRHYHGCCMLDAETKRLVWLQEPTIVANDVPIGTTVDIPAAHAFLLEDSLVPLLPTRVEVIKTSEVSSDCLSAMAYWVTTHPERFLAGSPETLLPQVLPNYMQLPHITVSAKSVT